MASVSYTLACLLLTASAGPGDTAYMNQRSFQIPIRIDPARRGEIAEVHLYRSNRDGSSWDRVGAVPPDKEGFTFFADSDGLYLFKVAVKGRDGRLDPPDIYQAPLGQRVVVDTRPPEIRILAADRQGDEVAVRWELLDDNPDLATLKLEYRTTDTPGGLWTPAPVADPQSGTARVRSSQGTPVAVRMQVQDLAQNISRWVEMPVAGTTTVARSTPSTVGPGSPPAPVVPAPAPAGAGGTSNLPPLPGGSDPTGWSPGGPPGSPSTTSPLLPTRASAPEPANPVAPGPVPPAPAPATPSRTTVLAQGAPSPETSGVSTATTARSPRPGTSPVRIINRKKITLDYEVTKFGASGLGSVELYTTRNEGKTWVRAGGREIAQPLATDAKGLPASLKDSLEVSLTDDGPYGFFLVVKSGAGIAKQPPQDGDTPQLSLELDTQPPEAVLYTPEPDPTKRDVLILRWMARDKNLGPAPASLFWSEDRIDWKPIAVDLPQTGVMGQHSWTIAHGMPHRVFLKLDVRDQAGNMSTAVSPEAITVDLSEPEVKSLNLGTGK